MNFAQKWPNLKFIHFDCRLKSDENEQNSKAIALVFSIALVFWLKNRLKFSVHFPFCNAKWMNWSNLSRFLSQNTKAIALLFWLKNRLKFEVHSLSNLQIQKWMNFKFESIFEQNTKAIALLFWLKNRLKFEVQSLFNLQIQKWLNFKFESIFRAKYQGYSLTVWLKNRLKFEVHSLFNLQIGKWMNFKFESIFEPKYQGYSLTILAQKSTQIWSSFTFQSADWKVMKMSDFWPKSKAIAFVIFYSLGAKYQGYRKYQGYSLTVWPKIAHFLTELQIWSFLSKIPRL